jgi:hypothetical protein
MGKVPKRLTVLLSSLLAVSLACACTALVDTSGYEFGDADASDDSGEDDSGTIEICDCTEECASHTCIPAPPGTWTGPVQLFWGATTEIPPCDGLFDGVAYEGHHDLECPEVSCSGCTCEVSGAVCQPPQVEWFSEPGGCADGNPSTIEDAPIAPSCKSAPPSTAVRAFARNAIGGSCTPQGGEYSADPLRWNGAVRACAASSTVVGGCASTALCAPWPQSDFLPSLCFFMEGDLGCPENYTERHVAYGHATDSRECTTCSCGDFQGNPCNSNVSFFTLEGCTGGVGGFPTNGTTCSTATSMVSYNFTLPNASGSCPISGGAPSGTCTPAAPTTFCCLPAP